MGLPGKTPLDFTDRVLWPTGEDEDEMAKTMAAILKPPAGLKLSASARRLEFKTPSHGMKKENYVHVKGFFDGTSKKKGPFHVFTLRESANSQNAITCLALDTSTVGVKVPTMKAGRYEVGGLCGLDVGALLASTPAWTPQMAPVLSIKKAA